MWLRDSSILVRRAAVLASADLPDREPIVTASTDGSPDIRCTAALAVGFAQDPRLLPLLDNLLRDPAAKVRGDAAVSLSGSNSVRECQLWVRKQQFAVKPESASCRQPRVSASDGFNRIEDNAPTLFQRTPRAEPAPASLIRSPAG
jgi:HEAT repeat protein